MKYIIGNWKSNKNIQEVKDWFTEFNKLYTSGKSSVSRNLEIVICPVFTSLYYAKKIRDQYLLPVKLGAQDLSPFGMGAYTGEVSANLLADLVEYVIIGHSERRTNFGESDEMLSQKVERAKEMNLKVIYCVQDEKTKIPHGVDMIAYEPVWAIGTGKTETPENANYVASQIIKAHPGSNIIYGGSVNGENVGSFLHTANITGVLPGGASLSPQKFWEIILNASPN